MRVGSRGSRSIVLAVVLLALTSLAAPSAPIARAAEVGGVRSAHGALPNGHVALSKARPPRPSSDVRVLGSCGSTESISPCTQSDTLGVGGQTTRTFTVLNNTIEEDFLTTGCTVSGAAASCSVSPASLDVPAGGASRAFTVTFHAGNTPGAGTVTATAVGNADLAATITLTVLPPPTYAVSVTPDSDRFVVGAGTNSGVAFFVRNTGTGTATFADSVKCTNTVGTMFPAPGCFVLPDTVQIAPNAVDTVIVAWTAGSAGAQGRVRLKAVQLNPTGTATDTGWVNALSNVLVAKAPVVDVAAENPGTIVNRSLCLSISLPSDAASECGDLRLVHPLPVVRTMNKARAPALIYNSQLAHPFPLVEANVKLGDSTKCPDTVRATLTVSGQNYSRAWSGADFQTGGTRRIAVVFDGIALATGTYPYTMTVTDVYVGGSSLQSQATGNLLVVNRSGSPYGAGWWVDGVEQLFFPTNDTTTRLWVGGDGSAALYTKVTSNVWAAVAVDRPDTLKWDGTHYTRFLPHGVRVLFNSTGQHVNTINRLGHTTTFTYTGSTLSSIGVPVPTGATAVSYGFTYTGGLLQTITSPSTTIGGHRTTTVTMTSGRITSIVDPDSTDANGSSVAFSYSTNVTNRIVTRTDHFGVVTTFAYDTLKKVSSASLAMGAGKTIAWHLRNSDSLTFAGHAVKPESAYVQLDGPRLGVTVTRFSVDKFDEPTQVVNALGFVTTLTRGDARWPALVTRLRYPNGHTIGATYDTRGNLASSTDSSHVQGSTFAKTTFQWDLHWDFLTQRTQPMGETWLANYDSVTGNRLYEQVGALPDTSRRIHYGYYTATTPGLLAFVQTPLATGRDSVVYDATLGNELKTRTPLGFWSRYVRDGLGRITQSVRPISTTDSVVTIANFDHFDRDTLSITYGLHGSTKGDSTIVSQKFDHEDDLLSVSRRSGPDRNHIGSVVTSYAYDNARRKLMQTSPLDSLHTVTEQWAYDDAGNDTSWTTRRHYVITYSYDALNELVERVIPSTNGVHYSMPFGTFKYVFPNPRYANLPGDKLSILADTAQFTYDSVGNLLSANNGDAHISRAYYPYGAMKADEEDIRTWKDISAGGDFSTHAYRDSLTYDLDGRRTSLNLPANVAPRRYGSSTALTQVTYAYDPVTGLLSSVQDVLGNAFGYVYDAESRLAKTTAQGGISDTLIYDGQGRLARRLELGNPGVLGSKNTLHADTLQYDMEDRLVHAGVIGDTVGNVYAQLGQITQTRAVDPTGSSDSLLYGNWTWDALGNRQLYTYRSSINENDTFTRAYLYEAKTGKLLVDSIQVRGAPSDYLESFRWADTAGRATGYDSSGNEVMRAVMPQDLTTGGINGVNFTASFYDASDRLRVVDAAKCRFVQTNDVDCVPIDEYDAASGGTYEEYRYDALGRRILTRDRRIEYCTSNSCRSTIDRYLWDGNEMLGEIRMPGDDSIEAKPGNLLERDTTTIVDVFSTYGRVFYTNGVNLDRPLDIIRNGYTHSSDTTFNSWAGAVAVITHTDWRGQMDVGTFDSGGIVGDIATAGTYCRTPPGLGTVCMVVDWPAGFQGIFNEYHAPYGPRSWFGSLTLNKQDGSGFQYSRNRYYDPSTGRFTQEDPLGLAGGLNAYGFANGDPVNFSDPFGLCAEDACIIEIGAGVYVAGVGVIASVAALTHGKELGAAIDAGADAAKAAFGSIVVFVKNKQAEKRANGEIAVINQHLDWLAGGGKGSTPGPDDRDKWKKDIARHLKELRKRIDQITGDRNKEPYEEQYKKLTEQLNQMH